jgi:predicted PurR-regulated permease PerM
VSSAVESPRSFLVGGATVIVLLLLWALRDLVILLSFAILLAYGLDPLVGALERLRLPRGSHLPRPATAAIVMLSLVIAGGWLMGLGVPRLLAELGGFVQGIPGNLERLVVEVRAYAAERGLSIYVDPALESMRNSASEWLQSLGAAALGWTGKLFRGLGQILGLAVLPLLTYYLLAEREAVEKSMLHFVPTEAQGRLREVLAAVDRALKSYVRGQALVSLIMGTSVGVALALLGLPLALLLGVVVGVAEVLPYLGFAIAGIAIALTGYGVDPLHGLLGVAAYTVINWLIGTFVTPRVMGRHLKMHPFVVTVSVLAGAQLFGPAGAMLALPGAAVIQSLVSEFALHRAGHEAESIKGARS